MATHRIASGQTQPGADWLPYGPTGIFLKVDTSAGRFITTPVYTVSIGGKAAHWRTTGATSIYDATSTSFTVYVRFSNDAPLTPADALAYQWHINWMGMEL